MADTNLQKYLAFLYCVEHGSFTAAARQLHYSQANISRMVADLEQDWGVVLLKRDHNRVMLTSEGLQLFPYIQALGNGYQALQEQLEQVRNLQSGLIRIGTFSSVATHWLPNLIKEFQKTYPNIHFEILLGDYTEIQHWIASSRVDCGFLPCWGISSWKPSLSVRISSWWFSLRATHWPVKGNFPTKPFWITPSSFWKKVSSRRSELSFRTMTCPFGPAL